MSKIISIAPQKENSPKQQQPAWARALAIPFIIGVLLTALTLVLAIPAGVGYWIYLLMN